jgi:hypothetical protein
MALVVSNFKLEHNFLDVNSHWDSCTGTSTWSSTWSSTSSWSAKLFQVVRSSEFRWEPLLLLVVVPTWIAAAFMFKLNIVTGLAVEPTKAWTCIPFPWYQRVMDVLTIMVGMFRHHQTLQFVRCAQVLTMCWWMLLFKLVNMIWRKAMCWRTKSNVWDGKKMVFYDVKIYSKIARKPRPGSSPRNTLVEVEKVLQASHTLHSCLDRPLLFFNTTKATACRKHSLK